MEHHIPTSTYLTKSRILLMQRSTRTGTSLCWVNQALDRNARLARRRHDILMGRK